MTNEGVNRTMLKALKEIRSLSPVKLNLEHFAFLSCKIARAAIDAAEGKEVGK